MHCAHGVFPVPAPATARLLLNTPVYGNGTSELVTPTGALLVTAYAREFGPLPAMRLERIGYGAGDRDPKDAPNVLRMVLGERAAATAERIVTIECEIDDMNPQLFGPLMDRLSEAGALDVFYAAVQMKKNRPGTLVTVLAHPATREAIAAVLFAHTTTIGVRYQEMLRDRLDREIQSVETPVGPIRFKVATRDGRVLNAAAEFDDCARIASERGLPIKEVQAIATRAWLDCARLTRPRPRPRRPDDRDQRTKNQERTNDSFLPNDSHRLCEQPAPPGDRLREDRGRRDRAVQAAVRRRDAFRHGERRALPERVSEGARAWRGSARLLRPHGAGVPRRLEGAGHLVRRLHPHDRAAPPRGRPGVRPPDERRGRRLRGALRRLVLRVVRGLQAGEGPRGRGVPDSSDEAGLDPREEPFLPALEVRRPAAPAFRGAPGLPRAGHPAERDPPADRRGPRGHLGEPRRPVVGHSDAGRSVERDLRLGGRADQLPDGCRVRHRRGRWPRSGGRRICT